MIREKMQPFISIYKNLATGDYLVQPYTDGPVSWTAFGKPTAIRADRFNDEIVGAVVENLSKFGKLQFKQEEAIRFSSDQRRTFQRLNLEVSVEAVDRGAMLIRPLKSQDGGRVAMANDICVIESHEIPSRLAKAITEAFEKAT